MAVKGVLRAPYSTWVATNPVLPAGVVAITEDRGGVRVGDGVTAWSGLTPAPSGAEQPVSAPLGLLDVSSDGVVRPSGTAIAGTGSSYWGGQTDAGTDGLRLVHAASNGHIDCKVPSPGSNGIAFRVDHINGGTERMKVRSDGVVSIGGQARVGSLGVGNSAAATVGVGLIARKIEVFDASGVSLGFVPVYATIT